ncbi:hypothetical protein PRIPAC_75216 [Pristionchus pacificus]|uniref:RNA binding protein n=1 Tax=Pristionchus pacificus TaxID=54126 RepID=A0A2A6CF61_PRIPA|nr:hypothetical protein PRIPAC_75216 [Pristionchus pacificus]|eukprot:PDM76844.1 RNA binding protein [Pristionchus pacificus]
MHAGSPISRSPQARTEVYERNGRSLFEMYRMGFAAFTPVRDAFMGELSYVPHRTERDIVRAKFDKRGRSVINFLPRIMPNNQQSLAEVVSTIKKHYFGGNLTMTSQEFEKTLTISQNGEQFAAAHATANRSVFALKNDVHDGRPCALRLDSPRKIYTRVYSPSPILKTTLLEEKTAEAQTDTGKLIHTMNSVLVSVLTGNYEPNLFEAIADICKEPKSDTILRHFAANFIGVVQLGCLQKDNANSVVTEPAVALPLSRLATPAVPPAASAAAAAFPERACAAVGSEEWKEEVRRRFPGKEILFSPEATEGRILIDRLPLSVNAEDFKQALHPFGQILEYYFPTHAHGTYWRTVHVKFESYRHAAAAIARLDGTRQFGARISVRRADYWSVTWGGAEGRAEEDSDRLGDRRGLERDSSATTPHDGMPQATVEMIPAEGSAVSDAVEWPYHLSDDLFREDLCDWMEAARGRWMRSSNWFCSCWECSD